MNHWLDVWYANSDWKDFERIGHAAVAEVR